MRLKLEYPLQAPAESTTPGGPSGASSGTNNAASVPTSVPTHVEIPNIPSQQANGSDNEPAGGSKPADDDIDWDAASTPEEDTPPAASPSQEPPKPPAQPSKPQEPQQPPAQPQPPQQPNAAPPAQPEDQPQQPTLQQPPQQPTTPPQPAVETPEQKQAREARELQEAQQAHQQLLDYYKIPDDLAARLASEPETVLPELAARMHKMMLENVRTAMQREIPQHLGMFMQQQQLNRRAEGEFFGAWPGLKQHKAQVIQVGQMYRQMNPNATPQEAIQKIGEIVCAATGIDIARAKAVAQAAAAAAPAVSASGFRPAATSSPGAMATPPSDNLYTMLAEEMLQDDMQP